MFFNSVYPGKSFMLHWLSLRSYIEEFTFSPFSLKAKSSSILKLPALNWKLSLKLFLFELIDPWSELILCFWVRKLVLNCYYTVIERLFLWRLGVITVWKDAAFYVRLVSIPLGHFDWKVVLIASLGWTADIRDWEVSQFLLRGDLKTLFCDLLIDFSTLTIFFLATAVLWI